MGFRHAQLLTLELATAPSKIAGSLGTPAEADPLVSNAPQHPVSPPLTGFSSQAYRRDLACKVGIFLFNLRSSGSGGRHQWE